MLLVAGAGLVLGAVLLAMALASYRPSDPSINTAAAGPVQNWVGGGGAFTADLMLSLFGPPAGLIVPFILLLGFRLARGAPLGRWAGILLLSLLRIILVGTAAALLIGGAVTGLPAGWGGAFGLSLAGLIALGIGAIGEPDVVMPFRIAAITLFGLSGCPLVLCLAYCENPDFSPKGPSKA